MNAEDNGNIAQDVDLKAIRRIHLVGVAGTGMGSFAGMLKAAGYQVTGSDENVYPPMSEMLAKWEIPAFTPYGALNLDRARPDLVIIGNVIRRVNAEAAEVRSRRVPQMSFPSALGEFFLKPRHSVVVAGTHGKTTTSAMLAHILVSAGKDPSFLVGGVTQNYSGNYRLGKGPHFVVEGDEYDTAYFDKGPKFLHYQPKTAILTSVEFDHADIYRDLAHYESSFKAFVELLPRDGLLAVSASYPNAVALAKNCRGKVVTYSANANPSRAADVQSTAVRFQESGTAFKVIENGQNKGELFLPLGGMHNVENALGVFVALRGLGLSVDQIREGMASFQGVKRRQEQRACIRDILVLDDFAHHPTAVLETIRAVRHRYPQRRLWAIFEPRSNTSRRNIHQNQYADAFQGADRAVIKVPDHHDKVPREEELNVPKIVENLNQQGIEARAETSIEEMVSFIAKQAQPGDALLVMSNGSFGGIIEKLIEALSA